MTACTSAVRASWVPCSWSSWNSVATPTQLEVAVSTLMSHLHCYILALAAERVSRDTDIWIEPPTLANLFDEEREVRGRRRSAEGP